MLTDDPAATPLWMRQLSESERTALELLWMQAALLGLTRMVDDVSQSWRLVSDDRRIGAVYWTPEACAGEGMVSAHTTERTLTLTGIDSHTAAIESLRWFFGWVDKRDALAESIEALAEELRESRTPAPSAPTD